MPVRMWGLAVALTISSTETGAKPMRVLQYILALVLILSVNMSHASATHRTTVVKAAKHLKVDHRTMLTTAKLESGFHSKARNRKSSAGGLFQFTNSTWKAMLKKHGRQYGYGPRTSKFNPRANALMAAHYQLENKQALVKVLGRSPTPGELYMAHLLGTGGATKILTSKSSAKASRLLPDAAKGNRKYFYTNKGKSRTVSQFRNYINWYFNSEREKILAT